MKQRSRGAIEMLRVKAYCAMQRPDDAQQQLQTLLRRESGFDACNKACRPVPHARAHPCPHVRGDAYRPSHAARAQTHSRVATLSSPRLVADDRGWDAQALANYECKWARVPRSRRNALEPAGGSLSSACGRVVAGMRGIFPEMATGSRIDVMLQLMQSEATIESAGVIADRGGVALHRSSPAPPLWASCLVAWPDQAPLFPAPPA